MDCWAIEMEQRELEAVNARLDVVERDMVAGMFSDEIMTMLRAGFDVVCDVNSKNQASEMLVASCIQGHCLEFVRTFKHKKHKKLILICSNGDFALVEIN